MNTEYRTWIIAELDSWAETFNNDHPDHEEEVIADEEKSYQYIHTLMDKFSKNECTQEDYEGILFHLWQQKSDG